MSATPAVKADNQRLSANRRQRSRRPAVCVDCGGPKTGKLRCRRCYELHLDNRRSYRESPDVAAMRLVQALGKRIADGDTDDLRELIRVEHAMWQAYQVGVAGLRENGYTDADISEVFGGITKQAVAKRFPRGAS